jgi:hypothetical protein
MQMQAHGQWKDALQIRADVARYGTLMRDQNGYAITAIVGMAMQNIPWRAGAAMPPGGRTSPGWKQARLWAGHFAAQCRAHRRDDLAAEAAREAELTLQTGPMIQSAFASAPVLPGVPNRDWVLMLGLNWTGASQLLQMLVTLPRWALLALLLFWKRVPGDDRSTGAVLLIWLAVVLVCIGVAGIALYYGGGWAQWIGFTLAGANTTPGVSDEVIGILRWLIALGPVVGGALFCGLLCAWRHRRQWRELDGEFGAARWSPAARRGLWLVMGTLVLLSLAGALLAPGFGFTSPQFTLDALLIDPANWILGFLLSPAFVLNLLVFVVAWWVFSGVWLAPAAVRPLAGENVKWYRQSLGASLVLGSALYLLLLLLSLQVRRSAELAFDTWMQRGEMAMMRAAQKAPNVR